MTENVRDFDRIVRSWAPRGEHHHGVVFTSPRRFHRGGNAYPDNLVVALVALLNDPPESTLDWAHWLTRPALNGLSRADFHRVHRGRHIRLRPVLGATPDLLSSAAAVRRSPSE